MQLNSGEMSHFTAVKCNVITEGTWSDGADVWKLILQEARQSRMRREAAGLLLELVPALDNPRSWSQRR